MLPCDMDSALKVLQYFSDAALDEAKRTVDLAVLIVLGRRGEPGDRTQDPALKPDRRREVGTVRAYAAQILRENGKPLLVSMIRTVLFRRFQIDSSNPCPALSVESSSTSATGTPADGPRRSSR